MGLKHFRRVNQEPYKSLLEKLGKFKLLKGHERALIEEKILMDDIKTDDDLKEEISIFTRYRGV